MELSHNERARVWERVVWWAVLFMITIGTCYMFFIEKNTKGFMGILTIAVLVAIAIGQKYFGYALPSLFVSIVYGFIFIAVGLGTFGGGYRIPHFDDFLHILSGIWLGYGSWIILKNLAGDHVTAQLPNFFIGLYMVCFSLAAAAVWELLEFVGDKWLRFTISGRNPDDTMFDMIDGLIGGAIIVLFIVKCRCMKK